MGPHWQFLLVCNTWYFHGPYNSLISGDNKGAAARFMEDWYEKNAFKNDFGSRSPEKSGAAGIPRRKPSIIANLLKTSFPGKPGTKSSSIARRVRNALRQADKSQFVSAFCQSNVGDASPNVLGAFCVDIGMPCDFNLSTCHGKNELCYGQGPGYSDEFESTCIIGERQFRKAVELINTASEQLKGKVDYRQAYVDLSELEVTIQKDGGGYEIEKTCPAAMGFDFAAGTTDGPGAFDFKPADDTPSVLPVQILRMGQLITLSVPGELTTTAGRCLRDAVKMVLTSGGNGEFNSNVRVVIAGLTNAYSQYVTTFEEYQGASTLYGPYTLDAYIQEFGKLAVVIVSGQAVEAGPQPPDLLHKQISLLPPVVFVFGTTPPGVNFRDVKLDVPSNATFKREEDTVIVTFWTAFPRNDLMAEDTVIVTFRCV
ncbi:ceramidase [Sarracenia purpurea var. burkii]